MVIDYLGKTTAFGDFTKKNKNKSKQTCQGEELRKQKFYSILLVIKIIILWSRLQGIDKSP